VNLTVFGGRSGNCHKAAYFNKYFKNIGKILTFVSIYAINYE